MKKNLVTAAFVGLLASGFAHAAPPEMFIDFPQPGETVSGIVTLVGWATGSPAVREVKFYLDGVHEREVGYGGTRTDVGEAFPSIPDAQRSGFAVALNTRTWSNGAHTIGVEVENANGEKSFKEISVIVSNAPGDVLPVNVTLDLSGASARVLRNGSVLLEKARVDGVQKSLVLEFQASSNHFVITSFAGIASDDDRDGDRVPDDEDDFPDDENETSDDDGNHIGDNDDANGDGSNDDSNDDDSNDDGEDDREGDDSNS